MSTTAGAMAVAAPSAPDELDAEKAVVREGADRPGHSMPTAVPITTEITTRSTRRVRLTGPRCGADGASPGSIHGGGGGGGGGGGSAVTPAYGSGGLDGER